MHEVLVNRLEGLSLPRKSVVRLTDRPDMSLDVYRGRKTTIQQINVFSILKGTLIVCKFNIFNVNISVTSCCINLHGKLGWLGGTMVLGTLPMLRRSIIRIIVGQGHTALAVSAGEAF